MQLDLQGILDRAGLGNVIGRDASSLRTDEWQAVDDEVVDTIQPQLQARQVLAPLIDRRFTGAGWLEVKTQSRGERSPARRDIDGEPEEADLAEVSELTTKSAVIHAESFIKWRHLEASRHGRVPLDVSAQADAGLVVAQSEEELAWVGDSDLGIDGVLRPTGYSTAAGSSWSAGAGAGQENVYADVNAMNSYLEGNNATGVRYTGPKLLVLNPAQALRANTKYASPGSGTPLTDLRNAGLVDQIVVTPHQTAGRATLLPLNRAYLKWYIMQDVTTDELPTRGRNVLLSTYGIETLVARVGASVVERTGLA